MRLPHDKMIALYRKMVEIRLFEEKVKDLYARGMIPGSVHLYIGQEAIATGVCAHLKKEDYITSTHRGHGHLIAKGADLKYMMAELFGKKTGYCKGKGGSMHMADLELGILGSNGIAGGGIPLAVGAGLSIKMRRTDQVTVCFFGDGSSNNGTFHEGLNFASVHRLPVVFICENNFYGISVPQKQHQAIKDISVRSLAYDMPGITIDGNEVMAVYHTSAKAIQRAREGKGPTLVECKTYRWRGHYEGDPNQGRRYRTLEEIQAWMKKCPIKRYEKKLIGEKILTKDKIRVIHEEISKRIEEAVTFANQSPYPDVKELFEDVFVSPLP